MLVSLAIASTVLAVTRSDSELPAEAPPVQQAEVAPEEYKYLVKDYNGFLTVFSYGSDEPAYITDVLVATLPEYDRNLLKDGIIIYSEAGLSAILEDYGS